jgi:hypothetical protein
MATFLQVIYFLNRRVLGAYSDCVRRFHKTSIKDQKVSVLGSCTWYKVKLWAKWGGRQIPHPFQTPLWSWAQSINQKSDQGVSFCAFLPSSFWHDQLVHTFLLMLSSDQPITVRQYHTPAMTPMYTDKTWFSNNEGSVMKMSQCESGKTKQTSERLRRCR